jgi:hypothetical protein
VAARSKKPPSRADTDDAAQPAPSTLHVRGHMLCCVRLPRPLAPASLTWKKLAADTADMGRVAIEAAFRRRTRTTTPWALGVPGLGLDWMERRDDDGQ